MKCLKCLGSGQQFTEALAAKKDCLSFPDSDTGERIAATAGTRMLLHLLQAPPAESHSPPLSKTVTASAAKGSGGGARRHCSVCQSRPHSGTEWQATHDCRRCLILYPFKKAVNNWCRALTVTGGSCGKKASGFSIGRTSSFCELGSRIALERHFTVPFQDKAQFRNKRFLQM